MYIYVQVRNIIIFHSLDTLNKNRFQATMTQSVELATAAQTVPGSTLGHFLLYGQNVGTCASCEQIGKKNSKNYKILVNASVKTQTRRSTCHTVAFKKWICRLSLRTLRILLPNV